MYLGLFFHPASPPGLVFAVNRAEVVVRGAGREWDTAQPFYWTDQTCFPWLGGPPYVVKIFS